MPVGHLSRAAFERANGSADVAALMETGMPVADGEAVLKRALPSLSGHPDGIAVVDAQGRYLGLVTQGTALAAMAGGEESAAALRN